MEFKLCLLFGTILCFVQYVASSSTEALLECGRVHQIDNIANHSTASASYSNRRCMLVCVIGNVILPGDSINEGQSCPEDPNRICRAGYCVGELEDALHECGQKHHLDFHKVHNRQGTAFTNDQCMLNCVIGGDQLSVENLHEGSPCPDNPNGVCRSGICVTRSRNSVKAVTESPTTTTPKPTTTITPRPAPAVTQPSTEPQPPFSPSKLKLLNISLESTDPALQDDEYISVYFFETKQSGWRDIGIFYGNPNKTNHYNPHTLNYITSKLNSDSQLLIYLHDKHTWLSEQYEDIYSLFAAFYQNNRLVVGDKENFITIFPFYRKAIPNDKLMDVTLRFTVVVRKD